MQKLGLIVLACLTLLGCRARKSQVHKSTVDSTASSLEQSNIEVKGGIYRVNSTSSTLDSIWQIGMRFENFSGIIHPDGRIEGKADQAGILNQGQKKSGSDQTSKEGDTTAISKSDRRRSDTALHKKEYDRQKEVEGTKIPWYVWLLAIAAVLLFGYWMVTKVKSKLKRF